MAAGTAALARLPCGRNLPLLALLLHAAPAAASFNGPVDIPAELVWLVAVVVGLVVGLVPFFTERVVAIRPPGDRTLVVAAVLFALLGSVPWLPAWTAIAVGLPPPLKHFGVFACWLAVIVYGVTAALCRRRCPRFAGEALCLLTLVVGTYQGYWFDPAAAARLRPDYTMIAGGFGFACGALVTWVLGIKWASSLRNYLAASGAA